tara:strand:+ start:505 stop:3198 length:2694 start_codon:yes stop_codon:yes gene_type:complete
MSAKYYTGTPKNLGKVNPCEAKSFEDLYKRYLFSPKMLGVGRDAFLAMNKKERQMQKRVDFICPCTFLSGDVRDRENAGPANLIILDIDDARDGALLSHSDNILRSNIEPFSFVAHHTASSTEEHRKIRVIVEADRIPPEDYGHAIRMVAACLGITPNAESLDVVHLMYLPTVFRDTTRDGHPVFAFNLSGRAVDRSDIKFYKENRDLYDAGQNLPERTSTPLSKNADGDFVDIVEFLSAPVVDVTLEDVSSALEHINPDAESDRGDSYHTWVSVGMAIKHQFDKTDNAAKALDLYDAWSKTGTGNLYGGRDDVESKWRSFRVHARGRKSVTMRTIFAMARKNGWESDFAVADPGFENVTGIIDWLRAEGEKQSFNLFRELDRAITQFANMAPEQNVMLDESFSERVSRICKSLDMEFGMTPAKVRKALKEKRSIRKQQMTLQRRPENSEQIPPWLRGVVYVASRGHFVCLTPPMSSKNHVFDNMFSSEMPDLGYPLTETGKNTCSPADYALNIVDIPRALAMTFDPTAEGQALIQQSDGSFLLNTYRDTRVAPDPATAGVCGRMMKKHMSVLLDDEDHGRMLLDYIAYIAQNPGKKISWAPLIQGAQGCGKSIIHHVMQCILGDESCYCATGTAAFTRFQHWLEGKQFITFDEVSYPRNSTGGMSDLKSLMTDSVFTVEPKGIDTYQLPNRLNFIFFTNHMRAIPIDEDDRRFFVLHSSIQTSDQVKALKETTHFDKFWNLLENHPGGFRHYFETAHTISNAFDINRAPDTVFKVRAVSISGSRAKQNIEEALVESENPLLTQDLVLVSSLLEIMRSRGFKGTSATYYGDMVSLGYSFIQGITLPEYFRTSIVGNPRRNAWVSQELEHKISSSSLSPADYITDYLETLAADEEMAE